jgi:prolyl-tRNA synthetase
VAPQQVVIVPIVRGDDGTPVLEAAATVAAELRARGIRTRVDDRQEHRPGFKFHEWELKGAPVRVELGTRDLEAGTVTVVRRDTGAKEQVALAGVAAAVEGLLDATQAELFRSACEERERRTLREPPSYAELVEWLREANGFAAAPWCGGRACEARVKADSAATIRCLPLGEEPSGTCICCGSPAEEAAVWGQAY